MLDLQEPTVVSTAAVMFQQMMREATNEFRCGNCALAVHNGRVGCCPTKADLTVTDTACRDFAR